MGSWCFHTSPTPSLSRTDCLVVWEAGNFSTKYSSDSTCWLPGERTNEDRSGLTDCLLCWVQLRSISCTDPGFGHPCKCLHIWSNACFDGFACWTTGWAFDLICIAKSETSEFCLSGRLTFCFFFF